MTKKNQMKKYVGLLEKRLKSLSCMMGKRMDALQKQIDTLERILSPDGLSTEERESAPFRIGDPVWWVNRTEGRVECEPNGVFGVFFRDGHWYIVNRDLDIDLVGSDMALPTRAEAERRLHDGKVAGEGV